MQKDKVKDLMDLVFPQQKQIPMAPESGIPQMEGLVPIQTTPIEDYDAMVEADQIDKTMVDPSLSSDNASAGKDRSAGGTPPTPPIPPTPEEDFRTKYLRQLEEMRNQNRDDLASARNKDNQVALLNNMNKAFSKIGTGVANRAGYTKLTSNPLEVASDKAGEAGLDNKANLENLAQVYGVNKDSEAALAAKAKAKLDAEDRIADKSYKQQMLDFKEKSELAKGEKLSPFEKTMQNQAGKMASDWVTNDRPMIMGDIQKLKEAEAQLTEYINSGKNVSGSVKGRLYLQDMVNPDGYNLQNTIASVTQKNLRKILGGQFAQKEGDNLIKRGYDPIVDESENLSRIKQLRVAMENAANGKDQAVSVFSKGGNSNDLVSQAEGNYKSQSENNDMVQVVDPRGNTRTIPKSKLQQALDAGGKLAE